MTPQVRTGIRGVVYEENPDGFLIRCTTTSAGGFLLLLILLVFCAFLASYVAKTIAATEHLGLGFTLVCAGLGICLVFVLAHALMQICGEVTFHLSQGVLHYFSGLWRIGRRIKIDTNSVDHVTEIVEHWGRRGHEVHLILLQGKRQHRVGRYLSRDQREFVLYILSGCLRKTER